MSGSGIRENKMFKKQGICQTIEKIEYGYVFDNIIVDQCSISLM